MKKKLLFYFLIIFSLFVFDGSKIFAVNGNGGLGVSYSFSKCGLNYVKVSKVLGQRFAPPGSAQPAVFNVAGIPACAVIEKAFLWCDVSGNGTAITADITNPASANNSFPMTIIGTDVDKCEGYVATYSYRADVTSIISGNGNYSIDGLPTSLSDPFNDTDGATLFIVYSDPFATYKGDIHISDGATVITGGGSTIQTITGFTACANPTSAVAFAIVSNFSNPGDSISMNGNATSNINGNWWDFIEEPTTVAGGQTASSFTVSATADCFNFVLAGVYFQTTSCSSCPLPSLNLTSSSAPATCGNSNGSASINSVTGGSAPYSYSWTTSPVQTTATATGLSAGSYTVTVTDASLCRVANKVFNIVNVGSPSTITIVSITDVRCNGESNGSATVSVSGGKAPYSFSWNTFPVQTDTTAINLAAGTYIFSSTDADGCNASTPVTINEPGLLTAVISAKTNVSCFGFSDGTAKVSVAGGNPPYSYSWNTSPIQTGITATGLSAGTYTITVTGSKGCSVAASTVISQPGLLTAGISAHTNVSCNGKSDGDATVTASGGTPGYTYSWSTSPAQITQTANAISAGTYTVIVKDAHTCTVQAQVTITEPPALISSISGQTNVSCFGGSNGSAQVSASGGSPGYSYAWNSTPAQNTATLNNVPAGTYQSTTTDLNGCTAISSVVITQPAILDDTIVSQKNVSCKGGNDGNIVTTTFGGTSPYSYSWNTSPVQTSSAATGLSVGSYILVVTDAHSCTKSLPVTISEPTALTSAISTQTNVSCKSGSDGSATVTSAGGTAPYTYLWNTSPAQTTSTAVNLSVGSYSVKITDNNGCTISVPVTLSEPNILVASISSQSNVSCKGGNDGTIFVSATGGTPGYNYSWNTVPLQTTPSANNLSAGTYSVIITDNQGCKDTLKNIIVTEPAQPVSAVISSTTNVLCKGNSTGSSTVSSAGGTPGYIYSWSTLPAQTNAVATNLSAGTYTVTVTDSKACSQTTTVTISEPATVVNAVLFSKTNVLCFGNSTGAATFKASGGTPGYTYLWSTSPAQTTAAANNLTAGTYTLVVSDTNSCSISVNVTITEPTDIILNTNTTNATCGNFDGTASVTASGGNPGYIYSWNTTPVQTTATATSLFAGVYSVTVTDASSCFKSISAIVKNTGAPTVSTSSKTDVVCNGYSTGSATATVNGGTPPYTYSWSTSPIQTTATANNLSAGFYTLNVKDLNNCIVTDTLTIIQPPAVSFSGTMIKNVSCKGGNNGSITLSVSGGTPGYSYSWNTAPVQTSATASNLTAGTYIVTLTDNAGCPVTHSFTITEPPLLTSGISSSSNINCNGAQTGSASVTAAGGTMPYTYLWTPGGNTSTSISNTGAGSYTVMVTDSNSCSSSSVITLTQNTPIALSGSSTSAHCSTPDGSASITANGGQAGYTYSWNTIPIQTTSTANNISAGSYIVTVTDVLGCTATGSVTVNNLGAAVVTINSVKNISCNGSNDGQIKISANGGQAPLIYLWMPSGSTSNTASNLSVGTQTLVVTDANNCKTISLIPITEPPVLKSTVASIKNVTCNGGNDGSAAISVSGGTPGYIYSWSTTPVQTADSAISLAAGTYTVTIRDANNCSIANTVAITQPPPINIVSSSNSASCGNSDGSAMITASGGTPGYIYSWNTIPIQTTSAAVNLFAGSYNVTVTDSKSCTATSIVAVSNIGAPTVTLTSKTNVTCPGGNNGSASISATGGVSPYSYLWSPAGGTSTTASNLSAGTYQVAVTDLNNCKTIMLITITQPPAITGAITVSNISCYGAKDGSVTVTASGGKPGYTYSWNTVPAQTTTTISNLGPGVYTLVITDANNCVGTPINVTVTQPQVLTVKTDTLVNAKCFGISNGSVTATVTGGTPAYTYMWVPSGGTNATANNLGAGTYTLTVTDAHGCKQTLLDTINQPPPLTTTISGINKICKGDSTILKCAPGQGILWSTGDTTSTIVVKPTATTTYSVVIANGGCPVTGKDTVYIDGVKAAFTPDKASGFGSLLVNFSNQSSGATSFIWTFGDLGTSTSTNPSHFYNSVGQYPVMLIAQSSLGCYDTAYYRFIVVDANSKLIIPNIFTPNDDGTNDLFIITASNISEFNGVIYNRWGEFIFEMPSLDIPWDGRTKTGQLAPDGTYFYIIKAKGTDGVEYKFNGSLTLLR